jgi:hypothetical protein
MLYVRSRRRARQNELGLGVNPDRDTGAMQLNCCDLLSDEPSKVSVNK